MKIGSFRGIGVYIHWSFWMLILFYLVAASSSGGLAAGLTAVAFIFSVFACVVCHEFGHALAAARFGIPTKDITLLPIGGVARLERIPEKPVQELVIALAGPAVNVVIAAILVLPVMAGVLVGGSAPILGEGLDFLTQLLAANIILVVFNMLPAFPMDGGRVLRSLIALRTGHLRATEIAARIGRWMALAFAIYGLVSGAFMLILLAAFIFIAGTAELMGARVRAVAGQRPGDSPQWQQRVWPQTAATFTWNSSTGFGGQSRQPPSDSHGDDRVIDAVDVRRIEE